MMERMFHKDNTIPKAGWIWVFGSNLGGRHGKGAAQIARKNFGAQYGQGIGRTGDAYAIPTKDRSLAVLPLHVIDSYVKGFILYAMEHPNEKFFVTRIGCGLAGYEDKVIAPMFQGFPVNCSVPEAWKEHFDDHL